jgi:hypothetical protein
MKVLITKQNEGYFLSLNPKLKFIDCTINTSIFKISEKKFIELTNKIRESGNNPFSIMSW